MRNLRRVLLSRGLSAVVGNDKDAKALRFLLDLLGRFDQKAGFGLRRR